MARSGRKSREAINSKQKHGLSRRGFLGSVGGLTAAGLAAGAGIVLEPLAGSPRSRLHANDIGPLTPEQRRQRAFDIRVEAAQLAHDVPIPDHPSNGDEDLYPSKIGNYSKGLPHNSLGEVDVNAYNAMLFALTSGDPEDFENIPMGCSNPAQQRKLVNPQAGLAFDLQGTDSHQLAIPPAPALSSAWAAGEAVELYWMAHLRDVEFTDYASNRLAQTAAGELSLLSDFRGPRQGGFVTAQTLFRESIPGATSGPYISQFMLKPTPFGVERIDRQMTT
ncbi:MAG: twin-arginine translocation pathway signal protein, partial [Candidatus Acidiferrales bacterium]